MKNLILSIVLALSLVSTVYALNLTSCVSCSSVTCPAGTVCHNIGSCPNGAILWGCQYSNGTVVSRALPNSTTSKVSTVTTTVNAIAPTTIAPTYTTIPYTKPSVQNAELIYISLGIVLAIVVIAAVVWRLKKQQTAH